MATNERERLLEYLELQLFAPALAVDPDRHPGFRREEVEQMREAMARERERLNEAPSGNGVVIGFREALDRSAENGLEGRLDGLGLRTFATVGEEFERLAAQLNVPGDPQPASFPD